MDNSRHSDWLISVEESADREDLALLEQGLAAGHDLPSSPRDHRPLAIFARNSCGEIIGGLRGATAWRWLHIKHLWVEDSRRGSGLGTLLVQSAEREARQRGCIAAWVDTFSFQAPHFYRRLGYEDFATLGDFPPGAERIFLAKKGLGAGEAAARAGE